MHSLTQKGPAVYNSQRDCIARGYGGLFGDAEADFIEEGEPDLDAKKPAKKKKAGKKGRQPTQEDWLTQIGRLKGRPAPGDWDEVEDL